MKNQASSLHYREDTELSILVTPRYKQYGESLYCVINIDNLYVYTILRDQKIQERNPLSRRCPFTVPPRHQQSTHTYCNYDSLPIFFRDPIDVYTTSLYLLKKDTSLALTLVYKLDRISLPALYNLLSILEANHLCHTYY